ncbi:MAG: HEAT repeat domain-containing protein [Isosphaeraceae bacterium]
MARLAFKPDTSFFRKIALGAVGTRAVTVHLARHGHQTVELERGSTDTKLWKDVKRKRVRIPDLVCVRCGLRIESRAKTKAELSMSHTPSDEARAWDFGMVDTDYVAFPVCRADEVPWSVGRLSDQGSYWHERTWIGWRTIERINYFTVAAFRAVPYSRITTKGVTEGSETSVAWPAIFATRPGIVNAIEGRRVVIQPAAGGRRTPRTIPPDQTIFVSVDDVIETNQVLASAVRAIPMTELACPGSLPDHHIDHLLASRERTLRFTGIKLARLRREPQYQSTAEALVGSSVFWCEHPGICGPSYWARAVFPGIRTYPRKIPLVGDDEEDVYVRLEAASYLTAVCGRPAQPLFDPYLTNPEEQTRLEAVIALAEAATPQAVEILSSLLDAEHQPHFLRSAAAWGLGRIGGEVAISRLMRAFSDVNYKIREEALELLATLGVSATPILLNGIRETDSAIAAGAAEALRQQESLPQSAITRLVEELRSETPSQWAVWLFGHLPRDQVAITIADLQQTSPPLHYAISLLWSFMESWIAGHWEAYPNGKPLRTEDNHAL